MTYLVVFVLLICGAACVPLPNDLEIAIKGIVNETDSSGNGVITREEIEAELLVKWDTDGIQDQRVAKQNFVTKWETDYGDNHMNTNTFFDNLDIVKNGILEETDILFHMLGDSLDANHDFVVTTGELEHFLKVMHPCGMSGSFVCQV